MRIDILIKLKDKKDKEVARTIGYITFGGVGSNSFERELTSDHFPDLYKAVTIEYYVENYTLGFVNEELISRRTMTEMNCTKVRKKDHLSVFVGYNLYVRG
jgi:hypothetical protein